MKIADLGHGWFATAYDDGSFTLRNPEKSQRINLSRSQTATFVALWKLAEADVAAASGGAFGYTGEDQ